MPTHHVWSQFIDVNYATPVAVTASLILTMFILKRFFTSIWRMIVIEPEEEAKDEGLPNFYRTVKLSDADWLISMNNYYEKTYAMKTVSKELTTRLDGNKATIKPIQGVAWYNILANLDYV